ncbi:hypothetical protein E4T38_09680 [Aureobasidium subglaciale]|nr:hypothetical protein E4T38_09680 [Aureobasidium subglaciale]KAI5213610.1 hypothetical protein E4T40_09622 [Aureobasidium subglaciale]KAI5215285.1 hypothetical protein E4T41_09660 [Aureobasidium subglaciale]KAI5253257.1 hypothetical protein E4T46_09637 [Aureobasidium subglaciale]
MADNSGRDQVRRVKVLCLHGKGTSAAILEAQTGEPYSIPPVPRLRHCIQDSDTGLDVTFDFVNAPFRSEPAPPVDHFYPGPFFSFYTSSTTRSLGASHAWLLDLIERQGPYDGVIGFSQGCALVGSLLLRVQRVHADQALHKSSWPEALFKFAIFICGGLPLSFLEQQGYNVSEEAKILDEQSAQALTRQASWSAFLEKGTARWKNDNTDEKVTFDRNSCVVSSVGQLLVSTTISGLDCDQMVPEHLIQIPTVHIYGARDPRMLASLQLARFCRSDRRKVYGHSGGHDLPKNKEENGTMARLSIWALRESMIV